MASTPTNTDDLLALVNALKIEEALQKSKPSKARSTRIRAQLLQIKKLTGVMRSNVLETSKAIPVKSRVKKEPVLKVTVEESPAPAIETTPVEEAQTPVPSPVKKRPARVVKK